MMSACTAHKILEEDSNPVSYSSQRRLLPSCLHEGLLLLPATSGRALMRLCLAGDTTCQADGDQVWHEQRCWQHEHRL